MLVILNFDTYMNVQNVESDDIAAIKLHLMYVLYECTHIQWWAGAKVSSTCLRCLWNFYLSRNANIYMWCGKSIVRRAAFHNECSEILISGRMHMMRWLPFDGIQLHITAGDHRELVHHVCNACQVILSTSRAQSMKPFYDNMRCLYLYLDGKKWNTLKILKLSNCNWINHMCLTRWQENVQIAWNVQ